MTKPKLEFLKNEAGEREGLGDAGIETFRDDPYASCARESGQNSRDAAVSFPVKMTFDVLKLKKGDLPFGAALVEAVDQCWDEAKKSPDQEKEQDFFGQAKALLKQDLTVLRIADSSTRGLEGPPDQPSTPFHALLKGSGVSNKGDETSGGSFGIGKNASFAVSDIQTVFYSTVYEYVGQMHFAAQGKVRLVSHTDTAGTHRRATGYWGMPGYRAITDVKQVPAWLQRTEIGTSIYCLGFRTEEKWAERIAYSLILNFFVAIQRGQMAFEINNGGLKINQNTIAPLFKDKHIRAAAEAAGRLYDLEFSETLHRCLLSPDAETTPLSIPDLGGLKLRVLVADGLPKRVGIIRNGMLITTGLENFGDRLERFKGSKDFVALLEPEDDASKLLKRLENPKHDAFSAQRLSDPAKRRKAELAMKALIRDLREVIKDATVVAADEEMTIDELTKLFAAQPHDNTHPGKDVQNDPEKFVYTVPKPERRRRTPPSPEIDLRGEGGRNSGKGSTNGSSRSDGAGKGEGSGGQGGRVPGQPVRLDDVRNLLGKEGPRHRTVWFTPSASGTASLQLDAPGINTPEVLRVVSTTQGKVTDGKVTLELREGERLRVDVTFDSDYQGPIEAAASVANVEPAE